ncbi:MAG: acetyl-CoA carboxylase carboxyl transferase subunit alpha, partial [Proteobacteria bacterium]|nr:acetyl-CoA carboxylase carboxyl transferase subunit alpha [Pseudomonadota bacterium]
MVDVILDFERPIVELAKRIAQLRELEHSAGGSNLGESIAQLERQANKLQERIFMRLTPWQRTQLARHPNRPTTLDYIDALFEEWTELHGDRAGFDDSAMVGGVCRFNGHSVVALGHQKGRNTKQNISRN